MKKIFTAVIIATTLFLPLIHAYSQSTKYSLIKIYRSSQDFFDDKYVDINGENGKGYTKDKVLVIKEDEVWGYKTKNIVGNQGNAASLVRRTDDIHFTTGRVRYFPVLVSGSICLYFNGGFTVKDGKIATVYTDDPVPCYASLGLNGKVFSFGKLDNMVTDDPELLEALKNVKKIRSGDKLEEYLLDRIKIVLDYNKRHPSPNPEINLFEKMLEF